MREKKKNSRYYKVQEALATLSLDDLRVALGRFCGPTNYILCEKRFGIGLTEDEVNAEIFERLLFENNSLFPDKIEQ